MEPVYPTVKAGYRTQNGRQNRYTDSQEQTEPDRSVTEASDVPARQQTNAPCVLPADVDEGTACSSQDTLNARLHRHAVDRSLDCGV